MVSQYRKLGLVALARKSRSDRGARRVVSPKIKAAIEGLALERPPLPIRSICRQIRQFAETTGERLPRYGTVYDLVREVPGSLLTLARPGSKAYSEGFDLVHRREAPRANAIWQADHALLSILLLREDGQTAGPWLTIVIDDYSRAIAGYYLGFDPPSSMRTALALRQGIWRKGHPHWHICGIPEVLYTDNGSDFTSNHLEQVAVDLKIRLVFSTPGKPQGRGRIERFFRTVNTMFLCELDGFIRRANHNLRSRARVVCGKILASRSANSSTHATEAPHQCSCPSWPKTRSPTRYRPAHRLARVSERFDGAFPCVEIAGQAESPIPRIVPEFSMPDGRPGRRKTPAGKDRQADGTGDRRRLPHRRESPHVAHNLWPDSETRPALPRSGTASAPA
jgi:transposase InsO family protein